MGSNRKKKKQTHLFSQPNSPIYVFNAEHNAKKKSPKPGSRKRTQQLSGFFPVPKHHFGNYKQRTAGMNEIGIPCDNNKVYLT
jgi:hypothetical protein